MVKRRRRTPHEIAAETALERSLFVYRAANPVFSWRQIKEREGLSVAALRQKYQLGIRTMFEIATGEV